MRLLLALTLALLLSGCAEGFAVDGCNNKGGTAVYANGHYDHCKFPGDAAQVSK